MIAAARTAATSQLVKSDLSLTELKSRFNESSFSFEHKLVNDPLFEMDRLMQLAQLCAQRPNDLLFDAGDAKVTQKWGTIGQRGLSAEEALRQIETAGAWIIMKHVELDPEYGKCLNDYTEAVFQWADEPLRKILMKPEMLVIISSPKRITPFHMDGEVNFLLQVRGHKTIRIYDRNDRVVLTEEEIERFYSVDITAATYKEGIDDRCKLYELTPGMGAHIPVNCPHWVQNGSEVSVSVSVNYEIPRPMRADLYKVNYMLRKAGLKPTPPGQSAFRDGIKRLIAAGFWATYGLVKRR